MMHQLLQISVSDRGRLKRSDTIWSAASLLNWRKPLNPHRIVEQPWEFTGVCATLLQTARNLLNLNGEMSEWLKEHAWKAHALQQLETYRSHFP